MCVYIFYCRVVSCRVVSCPVVLYYVMFCPRTAMIIVASCRIALHRNRSHCAELWKTKPSLRTLLALRHIYIYIYTYIYIYIYIYVYTHILYTYNMIT